ncbi:OLC1v1016018C1 [Oldenlandia corymbosa var. corymbosa]|uniref:OLC1v1016018C1 n=1 Tax=Oldenlandia corymbosa var. corymbosa TaxID=529605 RepID=A0AAV1E764_OLDCO|nr:OLC1v1016018C1 [Oldenlandia corymbosa var. corymbosa]
MNKFRANFLEKNLNIGQVLRGLIADKSVISCDEHTFASVLRACTATKLEQDGIEQLHAKMIQFGLCSSLLTCNPLIDLYSKNGFINSAKKIFYGMPLRDSVSWVAMISGFSRNGLEECSIRLYNEMRRFGVRPTPYIYSSVLSSCSKGKLYELGLQLHGVIYKWGYSFEIYVCNALVTLYSGFGDLVNAEQIFSEMQMRDGASYNSLISGLALQGYGERSLELFKRMHIDSLKPDCVTIASLLSVCASIGALRKGIQLHTYANKAGMCEDTIIEGSLLDLYVKCSDLEAARKVFLATGGKENVVLWNMMLVAYGQRGNLHESLQIFQCMQIKGLQPNQYTYPSILRTCTLVGALDLGEQIHGQVIKTGFQLNVYVCSVLILMYAKHGNLDTALQILSRLTERDVVSWTAMIAGFTQHDRFLDAIKLFIKMQDQGIRSDNIGFASVITACAGIQVLNQGRQIHAQSITSGCSLDLSVNNALVSLYARCGEVKDAYSVFEKNSYKDNISWNALISGFSQSGNWEEALKVFSLMKQAGVESDMFTYGSVISATANTTNIKQGKQVHAEIIKTGYNTEAEASNALITLYAKCGSLDDARREFLAMRWRNEVSWNAMITGYSQHGCGTEAIELFEEMIKLDVQPNSVTFIGVLSACSHVGLVDEGLSYFKSMTEKHGLVPKPEHYACVVDILGRAGYLSRAREFVESMPIEPDAMVWRTLLSACTVHKNTEIGELAANNLLQLEPNDSATYVLFSNMYAASRKWEYRNHARKLMKDRGVKKEPGRSWIEIKNLFHAFFAGDRVHPLSNQIYEYLQDLNVRVTAAGYVQDRHSIWNDFELEQKDPDALVHSEKLAIAFGLMNLSDSIPLHVMKNLRVCNDCHNWIKYVSKVANRTIVVRDTYRFHHFKEGRCSCKDYW